MEGAHRTAPSSKAGAPALGRKTKKEAVLVTLHVLVFCCFFISAFVFRVDAASVVLAPVVTFDAERKRISVLGCSARVPTVIVQ